MTSELLLTAVVPTLGKSPVLDDCLRALDEQQPRPHIVLVHSGSEPVSETARELADVTLESPDQLGFARATNRGIEASETPWVAAVNDDVVVQEGWTEALLGATERHPQLAALQGANTVLAEPNTLDGCGIAWNAWWQAVQIRAGTDVAHLPRDPFAIPGASATATAYRRSALEDVALPSGDVFDPLFESYYEDVDLALRLAARGHTALCVPAARAAHVGSATGKTLGRRRVTLIYGNRLLTLLRSAGAGLIVVLPRVLLRDLLDGLRQPGRVPGILGGWWRAARLRRHFTAQTSEPRPSLQLLHKLTRGPLS